MAETDAFERLRSTTDYMIFKKGRFDYTIHGPNWRGGTEVVAVTMTLWGAKRAIRKHRARRGDVPFWEQPVVHREPQHTTDAGREPQGGTDAGA